MLNSFDLSVVFRGCVSGFVSLELASPVCALPVSFITATGVSCAFKGAVFVPLRLFRDTVLVCSGAGHLGSAPAVVEGAKHPSLVGLEACSLVCGWMFKSLSG